TRRVRSGPSRMEMEQPVAYGMVRGGHTAQASHECMRDDEEVTEIPDHTTGWRAPTATGPIRATVPVPSSKSLMTRALVLAAQATEPSRIENPLRSRDTELMARALSGLGARVDTAANEAWTVMPATLRGPTHVDCG